MTTPTPPATDAARERAQSVLDNPAHYTIESNYLAKDVLALLADLAQVIEQRDTWHQMWGERLAEVKTLAETVRQADIERDAARQEAQRAQAELEQVKAIAPEATAIITAAMDCVTELLARMPDAATNEWCRPSTQRLVAAVSRFADTATVDPQPQADERGPHHQPRTVNRLTGDVEVCTACGELWPCMVAAAPVSPAAVPQTSSEQDAKRRERVACPFCGKSVAGLIPRGGDGRILRTMPHHTPTGDPCRQADVDTMERAPAASTQDAADSGPSRG